MKNNKSVVRHGVLLDNALRVCVASVAFDNSYITRVLKCYITSYLCSCFSLSVVESKVSLGRSFPFAIYVDCPSLALALPLEYELSAVPFLSVRGLISHLDAFDVVFDKKAIASFVEHSLERVGCGGC